MLVLPLLHYSNLFFTGRIALDEGDVKEEIALRVAPQLREVQPQALHLRSFQRVDRPTKFRTPKGCGYIPLRRLPPSSLRHCCRRIGRRRSRRAI